MTALTAALRSEDGQSGEVKSAEIGEDTNAF